jgi:hypothetical protein
LNTFYKVFFTLAEIYLLRAFYELYGKDAAVMALVGMLTPLLCALCCDE